MQNSFKLVTLVSLVAAAVAAQAQVTYSFEGTGMFYDYSFNLTTADWITQNTTLFAPQMNSQTNVQEATFDTAPSFTGPAPFIQVYPYVGYGSEVFFFSPADFGHDGVFSAVSGTVGSLSVSGSPAATPEPESWAILGLGALGLLRRKIKSRR